MSKELKICKYTKSTKKQIDTKSMAGMTQKGLNQPHFHCGHFCNEKYQKQSKEFKVTNIKSDSLTMDR